MTSKPYLATEHVREHLVEAADESALLLRKLMRGEIEPTRENLQLAQHARGALGAFTRYEATLSARDQTSVIVSKMLAGEDPAEFRRYIAASLPEHPAIRDVPMLKSGEAE